MSRGGRLVQGGGLPAERGELARAGNCDGPGVLAATSAEMGPARIHPLLSAPSDRSDTWVLAGLAGGDRLTDCRTVAVVVGGFDEEPAGVRWAGFGDLALHPFGV